MRTFFGLCAGLALLAVSATALAGSVQVGPILVQMLDSERASTITLRNAGAEPVNMQVRTMDWSQADGEDALSQSQTLVASPPTFSLAPGESQTVRLVVEGADENASERAWRLVVDELPRESSTAASNVATPVRLFIPVFLSPSSDVRSNLTWSARRDGDAVLVSAHNSGDGFERIAGLSFAADGAAIGDPDLGYVLAGATRVWRIDAPAGARSITATGAGASGEVSAEIPIE